MVVGLWEQANRVDALVPAAGVPDVEVGHDGRRVERGAVRKGHAVLEVEGEGGGGVILLPAFGNPGADLAVSVDVNELVGHMAPDVTLEAGDRAVVRNPGVAQRVDEEGDITATVRAAGTARLIDIQRRHGCHRRGGDKQLAPGKLREAFGHQDILVVGITRCARDNEGCRPLHALTAEYTVVKGSI